MKYKTIVPRFIKLDFIFSRDIIFFHFFKLIFPIGSIIGFLDLRVPGQPPDLSMPSAGTGNSRQRFWRAVESGGGTRQRWVARLTTFGVTLSRAEAGRDRGGWPPHYSFWSDAVASGSGTGQRWVARHITPFGVTLSRAGAGRESDG